MDVVNMTRFMNRQRGMSAIGDFRLPFRLPYDSFFYGVFGIFLWSYPVGAILPDALPWYITFAVAYLPPLVFAYFAGQPIFSGRSFLDWLFTVGNYWFVEPNMWVGAEGSEGSSGFTIHASIWVSRRGEYARLVARLNSQQPPLQDDKP